MGCIRALPQASVRLEPDLVVADVQTMETRRAEALGTSRLLLFLLVALAGLALVLALVGSYGVVR